MRLAIWVVELGVLLVAIELFLLPSCDSPEATAPPPAPPRPAPEVALKVELPSGLEALKNPLLPPLVNLAAGSASAQKTQLRYAQEIGLPLEVVNSVGMRFRLIPPGSYLMGSPESEAERWEQETQHVVSIDQPFYMGVTEVTQEQWETVMSSRPFGFDGAQRPAEEITWYDCRRFSLALCEREGVPETIYRMPTEEEWEYACRAGTTTAYYFGDDPATLDAFAEYRGNNSSATVPVPSGPANAWGLHNMLGNVQEWCFNTFRLYESGEPLNPQRVKFRSLRGGHWLSPPDQCRAAERGLLYPSSHGNVLGFRIIREVADFKAKKNL